MVCTEVLCRPFPCALTSNGERRRVSHAGSGGRIHSGVSGHDDWRVSGSGPRPDGRGAARRAGASGHGRRRAGTGVAIRRCVDHRTFVWPDGGVGPVPVGRILRFCCAARGRHGLYPARAAGDSACGSCGPVIRPHQRHHLPGHDPADHRRMLAPRAEPPAPTAWSRLRRQHRLRRDADRKSAEHPHRTDAEPLFRVVPR